MIIGAIKTLDLFGFRVYENPFEDFSIGGFSVMLLVVVFIFIISWFTRKGNLFLPKKNDSNLKEYVLDFSNHENGLIEKQVSKRTKFLLYCFSLVIIFTPFSEFVLALNQDSIGYWPGFCFVFS